MDNLVELDKSIYAETLHRMMESCSGEHMVTEKNVYQEGCPQNKPLVQKIVRDVMLPGSRILGLEHLEELLQLAKRKKPCLILMEHYSNFDLPCFIDLLEQSGETGNRIAGAVVAVAGAKLNEESRLTLSVTEIYTRVVLIPSRTFDSITDPKERREAERRRAKINIAAMKALMHLRRDGRLILVFPTGTRYRPWDPSTGRGLKEIDSYLKFYSYMVTVAINGNTLLCNPKGSMSQDFPVKDVMLYTVSPVQKCSEFRREALKTHSEEHDHKQHVADSVMAALAALHEQAEKIRLPLLKASGQT